MDWTRIESSVVGCEITIPKLTDLMKPREKTEQGKKMRFPVMPFLQLPEVKGGKTADFESLPNIFN